MIGNLEFNRKCVSYYKGKKKKCVELKAGIKYSLKRLLFFKSKVQIPNYTYNKTCNFSLFPFFLFFLLITMTGFPNGQYFFIKSRANGKVLDVYMGETTVRERKR